MRRTFQGYARTWPIGCALIACAYFITGKLGLLLAIPPGYASAVWPPSGIALAGLLLLGPRFWPGILLGSFLVNIGIGYDGSSAAAVAKSVAVAANIGLGASLQAQVGYWLLRRHVGLPTALADERDVGAFLLLAGPVACLVNASWSIATLYLVGAISVHAVPFSWWTWWVGDTLGVIVLTPLALVWLGRPRARWRRRRLAITLPLVVLFALAIAFFVQASAWERDRIGRSFAQQAEMTGLKLRSSIDDYLNVLQYLADFRAVTPRFEREDFRRIVAGPLARHPGILALSWNPRILAAERPGFEAALRREGHANDGLRERDAEGSLVVAQDRDDYTAVRYIEPYDSHAAAIGYDVASEPVRRAALDRVRQTGQAAATATLRLVQDRASPDGFLVFQPVYAAAAPTRRRDSLEGYVVGVFRLRDLLAAAVRDLNSREVALYLDDVSGPGAPRRLFDNQVRPASRNAITWDYPLAMAQRQWLLRLSPTDEYLNIHRGWQAWTALAAGLLFTGLLGAFLLVISGRAMQIGLLVKERTRELAKANHALRDEVGLRRQREDELEQRNAELAKANVAKDRFLATMSHELRTPLNAVLGFTGTLLMKLPGPLTQDQEKQLTTIRTSARHLLALINGVLDVAKIESGKFQVRLEPTQCLDVLKEVAETLAPLAAQKNLGFRVQAPDVILPIHSDRRALSQILFNLVGNAIKFTDTGSVAVCLLQREEGEHRLTEISVIDTGCGIRPEDRCKLFQAFSQVDDGTTRRYEGTGLGLYLSGKLALAIGGQLSVTSADGGGSVFMLTLETPMVDVAEPTKTMDLRA